VLGGRPVVGGDLLDGVRRETGRRDRVTHDRDDGGIGVRSGRRAAQQHGVAGLEADAGGVGGDVGASFVDHADDADGDADLLHAQAVGQRRAAHDLADRVRQCGHVAQTLGERGHAVGVEGEPVDHVLRGAPSTCDLDVECVGGQQVVGGGDQGLGRSQQRRVLGRAREGGQRRRGRARPPSGLVHLLLHAAHSRFRYSRLFLAGTQPEGFPGSSVAPTMTMSSRCTTSRS
jgi:hypothetical protein